MLRIQHLEGMQRGLGRTEARRCRAHAGAGRHGCLAAVGQSLRGRCQGRAGNAPPVGGGGPAVRRLPANPCPPKRCRAPWDICACHSRVQFGFKWRHCGPASVAPVSMQAPVSARSSIAAKSTAGIVSAAAALGLALLLTSP